MNFVVASLRRYWSFADHPAAGCPVWCIMMWVIDDIGKHCSKKLSTTKILRTKAPRAPLGHFWHTQTQWSKLSFSKLQIGPYPIYLVRFQVRFQSWVEFEPWVEPCHSNKTHSKLTKPLVSNPELKPKLFWFRLKPEQINWVIDWLTVLHIPGCHIDSMI